MSFMTIGGDRSGVNTPTHEEKAQSKIRAALSRLNEKDKWTKEDINQAIEDLMAARFYMTMVK